MYNKNNNTTPRGLRDGVEITKDAAGFEDYAFKKTYNIDKSVKKRVLITGAGSYIGQSFKNYAKMKYPNISVDEVDIKTSGWQNTIDWSKFDTVFHVAGIAHSDVGHVDQSVIERYYFVNTDLAIETAKLCKNNKISHFIFMSSAIIYGDSAPYGKKKIIDENTLPSPTNFYGDSKWQADKGVRAFADNNFNVSVLRPPMIYGKCSKGNYPLLATFAKKLPFFPNIKNQRSMLYIENLCEFLCLLILSGKGGIYFPQNSEYTQTSEMVKEIANVTGKRIIVSKVFTPILKVLSYVPGKIGSLVNKAFGNIIYEQKISRYDGFDYQKISLKESIKLTEGTF